MKKKISICVACFNEVNNVLPMAEAIVAEMEKLPQFDYEIIFTDNASIDGTQDVLRKVAQKYQQIKVIINSRNYGPSRSPMNAIRYAAGDAVLSIPCDFQDPPRMIPEFIKYWEEGYSAVYGQKIASKEGKIKYGLRTLFYHIIGHFSETELYWHISGIALNDKSIIDKAIQYEMPPKDLLSEMGLKVKLIPYCQEKRRSGKSSFNLSRLIDYSLSTLVKTSTIPLRIATIVGCLIAFISFLIGFIYLVFKLCYWNTFNAGMAPLIIGMFFLGSIQLIFIGLLGEYVGAIYKKLSPKPSVVVKEFINFDEE